MLKRLAWLSLVAAFCASCEGEKFAEGRLMFRELLTLRDQIAKEFHEQVVDVSVNDGDRMTVKFVNSPLSSRGSDEKQQRADAVATFVAANYKRPVSSVAIEFDGGGTYLGRPAPKK